MLAGTFMNHDEFCDEAMTTKVVVDPSSRREILSRIGFGLGRGGRGTPARAERAALGETALSERAPNESFTFS